MNHQKAAIEAIKLSIKRGKKSMSLLLSTGTGKTFTIVFLINDLLTNFKIKKILIIVDRLEIKNQYHTALNNYQDSAGIESFVQISTIQQLYGYKKNEGTKENKKNLNNYGAIIIDDCSRDISRLKNILSSFSSIKIGFTTVLTKETVDYFGEAIYQYSWEQAVKDGLAVNYIGKIEIPHTTERLGDLANISLGKPQSTSKFAINRTGSKIVWLDEEAKLIDKNNIFISPNKEINPYYLFLYLNSNLGISRIVRGNYIPHVNVKELREFLIILPGLENQNQIAEQALRIKNALLDLRTIIEEGENSIKNNLFRLDSFQDKLNKFSQYTKKMVYQSLPFPLAVVYRKFVNAPNHTQRFSLMIELFESALRFMVLVNLVDYLHKMKSGEDIKQDIPLIGRLIRPSLGDWVQLFNSLTKIKTNPDSEPFLKEVKEFNLDKYRKVLQEFVEIRNQSLRGHGGTWSEEEYFLKVQQYFPKLEEFIASLSFLSKYQLVKTHSLEKDGDYYKISSTDLMGGTTPFEHKVIESRKPIDTNKVIYFNSDLDYLELDPFIILELCPECKRSEVLLLDKFNKTNIYYFGPESGHKPTIANADKLPITIKQFIK